MKYGASNLSEALMTLSVSDPAIEATPEPAIAGRDDAVRLAFISPPLGWNFVVRVVACNLFVLCGMLLAGGKLWMPALALGPAFALMVLARGLIRKWRFRPNAAALPPITVDAHCITLPVRAFSTRTSQLPLDQVRAVVVTGRLWWRTLVIDGHRKRYAYPLNSLAGRLPLERLRTALQDRITAQPGGANQRAAMDARHSLAQARGQAWPWATLAALVALGVTYGIQRAFTSPDDGLSTLDFGASAPLLFTGLLAEQWWRMVSSTMLHLYPWHVIDNALALLVFGTLLERLAGLHRTVMVMLLTGICASLVSAELHSLLPAHLLPPYLYAAGFSGAIFGLIGAFAVLSWRFRTAIPPGMRLPRAIWIVLALLDGPLVLPVMPQVDILAHAGGFAAGLALGALFALEATDTTALRRPAIWAQAGCFAILAVWTSGLVLAAVHAHDPAALRHDRAAMASRLLGGGIGLAEANFSNTVAWSIAIDPAAPAPLLEQASELAARAVAFAVRAKLNDDFWAAASDTLATLEYRSGDLASALHREIPLLGWRKDVDEHFAAFLDRSEREGGPQVWNGGRDDLPGLTLQNGAFRLTVPEALPAGARLYAVLRHHGLLAGLLTVQVPPAFSGARTLPIPWAAGAPKTGDPPALWTDPSTELVIGLYDRRGCACPKPHMGPTFSATPTAAGVPPWMTQT